jgi:hypothetical protein
MLTVLTLRLFVSALVRPSTAKLLAVGRKPLWPLIETENRETRLPWRQFQTVSCANAMRPRSWLRGLNAGPTSQALPAPTPPRPQGLRIYERLLNLPTTGGRRPPSRLRDSTLARRDIRAGL